MRIRLTGSVGRAALAAISIIVVATVALPGAAEAAKSSSTYYVSLGDSYSVGYQPGKGATFGYAGYVAQRTHFTLVNFGCAGATTISIIDTIGCPDILPRTAGAVPYPTSAQATAAEAFIRSHRRHIGLITVSIGGNDVTACASSAKPIICVATAVGEISKNVTTLASGLRGAAGPKVPIIGLTYPDVILGEYVFPSQPATSARITLAQLSVTAFKSLINPTLSKAYAQAQARFVDVTSATGAYTPLTRTEKFKPYGAIPVAVASVCTLTWFCAQGNIHARTRGYTLIGKLIVAKFATIHRG